LVARVQRGEFTQELGVRVTEQRHAELRREALICEHACAASTAAHAAASALPEAIRASFERARAKALSPPTGGDRNGVFSSMSSASKERD
jgi:hypothetical protein